MLRFGQLEAIGKHVATYNLGISIHSDRPKAASY